MSNFEWSFDKLSAMPWQDTSKWHDFGDKIVLHVKACTCEIREPEQKTSVRALRPFPHQHPREPYSEVTDKRFSPYYPCQMTLCHMRDPGLWLSILRYQVCLINFWYDKSRWEYTYFLHRERWQRDPAHVYLWSAKSCRVVIKDRIVTELFRNFYNDLLHLNILLSRCNMGIGRVIKARWQDGPALASNPPKQYWEIKTQHANI